MNDKTLLHVIFYPTLFILGIIIGNNLSEELNKIGWEDAKLVLKDGAKEGDAESQYYLGLYILEGKGTTRDPKEGFSWIQKAAKNNYIPAQFKLAWMYEKGVGTPKDETKALEFYQKAAKNAADHLKRITKEKS